MTGPCRDAPPHHRGSTLPIRHVINRTFRRGRDHSTRLFAPKPRVSTEFKGSVRGNAFREMFVSLH
ncbi:hypothetical protein BSLA_02r1010 [Burkholderia stabilis]|nr:hypothetical protein BSLA_02r1010 [Burkholderia stabilis]